LTLLAIQFDHGPLGIDLEFHFHLPTRQMGSSKMITSASNCRNKIIGTWIIVIVISINERVAFTIPVWIGCWLVWIIPVSTIIMPYN
jgi:hypothetical protein